MVDSYIPEWEGRFGAFFKLPKARWVADDKPLFQNFIPCPYSPPGHELWVRESWRIIGWHEGEPLLIEYCDGGLMEDRSSEFPFDEEYGRFKIQRRH